MEVTIRPHSLWSLCRVATTSSIPWDKIVSLFEFEFWSWNWQSSQRYWPISQWDLNFWLTVSEVLKPFNRTCPDLHDTFKIIWTFQQEKIRKETFIKVVKKLCYINVHFVMHGQSDSEESFSSVTSSAHGNHDKSNNLWKLVYRAEKQGECLNKFLKILNASNKTCWITFNENWNWKKLNLKILFGDGSWSTLKLLYRPKCSLKAKPEHSQTKLKRSHSVQSAPENYCLFPKK